MKKLAMVFLVALMAAGSCFAQMNMDPAERLKREIDGLTTALSLTPDQVAKVTPIVTDAQQKQMDMFQKMRDGGMDRDKMREEMTKMRTETDAKIKAVLTAQQAPKLEAYRKQQDEERAKRMQQMQQNR